MINRDNKSREGPSKNGGGWRAIGTRDTTEAVKLVIFGLVGALLIFNNLYNGQSPPSLQDSTMLRDGLGQTEGVLPSSRNKKYEQETTYREEEEEEVVVEGAILKNTSTSPSFRIWIYPPDKDIISKKIHIYGMHVAEELQFTKLVVDACNTTTTPTEDGNGVNDGNPGNSGWAVDIGAYIGFHTLHMAASGMNVIAFEPALDTASLLRQSVRANGFDKPIASEGWNHAEASGVKQRSPRRVNVVRAAAGERKGHGRLVRHSDSAGITILQIHDDRRDNEGGGSNRSSTKQTPLPFGVKDVVGDDIAIVRPEDILAGILPETTARASHPHPRVSLSLLKVDAEGHELHALRGTNLKRFPFRFLTFEVFPELLWSAGGTDPLDLLDYVASLGYRCATKPSWLLPLVAQASTDASGANQTRTPGVLMTSRADYRAWYENEAVPYYRKTKGYHQNFYCELGGVHGIDQNL